MIPYWKQYIDKNDIDSVIDVLKSNFLTTWPKVEEFEKSICKYICSNLKYDITSMSYSCILWY